MKKAFLALLRSKRIQLIVIGAGVTYLTKKFEMDPETSKSFLDLIWGGVMAYVAGNSLENALTGGKSSHSMEPADAPKEE